MSGCYFPTPSVSVNFGLPASTSFYPGEASSLIAPALFRDHGYRTACFSENRAFVRADTRLGAAFDYFREYTEDVTQVVPNPSLAWIREHRRDPFFLYVHKMDTHGRYRPLSGAVFNQWVDPAYNGSLVVDGRVTSGTIDPRRKADAADIRQLRGLYDGCVLSSDFYAGQLLALLEELGLVDDTIIVYTSDHGELLLEDGLHHGHYLEWAGADESHHIPLVMVGPGIPAARRIDSVVESIDILPTLLDLCGIACDSAMDGESLGRFFDQRALSSSSGMALTKAACYLEPGNYCYPGPAFRLMLTAKDAKYEYNAGTKDCRLWRIPDRAGNRASHRLLDNNAVRSFEKKRDSLLKRAYSSKAVFAMYMPVFVNHGDEKESNILGGAELPLVNESAPVPAGWSLRRLDAGAFLLQGRPEKTSNEMTYCCPNIFRGRYRVFVEMNAGQRLAVKFLAEDAFRPVVADHVLPGGTGRAFADCGVCELAASTLKIVFTLQDTPAAIRAFVIGSDVVGLWESMRDDLAGPSTLSASALERQEALKALGYLGD